MLDMLAGHLDSAIVAFTQIPWWDNGFFAQDQNVRGLLATLIVCFVCGSLGSQVVGNRMAFFSDALAHCAFAGVGLGLLFSLLAGTEDDELVRQRLTIIMVCFGVGIGLMIALVRDQTGLASDTVIGVFFAGALGVGALCTRLVSGRRFFSIEDFIFGSPNWVSPWQIILLFGLAIATITFQMTMYNSLMLASISPTLSLSRRVPVRLSRYLFIVLLALMVNLSQQITGTLLINGLLIVPAAAAANVASNLRQLFWLSIIAAMAVGFGGYLISWEVSCNFPRQSIGISGAIVLLSVLVFLASIPAGRLLRRA
ncbi:MAG TPA: metal ABC transporter permease [Gemmataceae bacterium]|nr:metal ABC transporter permease [Gemmataceae bacterium]